MELFDCNEHKDGKHEKSDKAEVKSEANQPSLASNPPKLDFDGVLHPFFPRPDRSDEENQLFSYLPRLEAVLQEFGDWQIVIASSWRDTLRTSNRR